jgi:uncharacterized glyoxalase superfamily protein PhnB
MFRTNAPFRQKCANAGSSMVWSNLESKEEVDELYRRWRQAGGIVSEPQDKPWRLREFTVTDLNSNQLRVFYDFSWELPA